MPIEITDSRSHLVMDVAERSGLMRDSGDDDWVFVDITARLPGFHVDFRDELYLSELHGFYQDIKRLHEDLRGKVTFDASQGFLSLKADMDSQGHVHWIVTLLHPVGTGESDAQLRFHMDSDQSYLPSLLRQIETVLEQFPIGQWRN